MQRGITRRRSSTDEKDSFQDQGRSRQRQRRSAVESTASGCEEEDGPPTSFVRSTHPDHPSNTTSHTPMTTNMGHPIPSTNGSSSTNGAGSGPSGKGHSASSSVQPVRPKGKLMYEDDRDWSEHQDLADLVPDPEAEDVEMEDGVVGGDEGTRRRKVRPGIKGGKRMPVDREEVVRLVLQGLRDIGYRQSADTLEAESGYQLSNRPAADFQAAILGGRWSEAVALLPQLGIDITPSSSEPASSSSSIASGKTKAIPSGKGTVAEQAKFLISQQKYLEYLEVGQQKKALATLRSELAPATKDSEILHTLSSFMMSLDKDDLFERAGWDGAAGTSRRRLLEHLQPYISPEIMVPQRRLATLLDQARRHQALSCLYHQDGESLSLYTDHKCASGQFPTITTHILADHTDEVWRIEWSPDGMMLASAGKDRTVVLWQLKVTPKEGGGVQYSVIPLHHLREHRDSVEALAWSPSGKTLVTGAQKSLYIWDTETGSQRPTTMGTSQHMDTISAIQWKPDGSEFLVSSMDCKLMFYNPAGNVVRQWSFNTLQVGDFIITPDGSRIIAITTSLKRVPIENKLKPSMSARVAEPPGTATASTAGAIGDDLRGFGYGSMEHALMIVRLADKEITDWSTDLRCELTSVKLSADGKRILISCNPDEIQLWSTEPHLRFLRKFTGHIHSRFLIRSGFGAPRDRFVLSGSEDGHVYVWQSNSSNPIEVLSGHDDTVNAVAWNPVASRRIFASCSDDGTIRIWQPPVSSDGPVGAGGATDGVIPAEEEGMVL